MNAAETYNDALDMRWNNAMMKTASHFPASVATPGTMDYHCICNRAKLDDTGDIITEAACDRKREAREPCRRTVPERHHPAGIIRGRLDARPLDRNHGFEAEGHGAAARPTARIEGDRPVTDDAMTDDAVTIYQTHLDVSTRFVFAGDATGYAPHTQLPFVFRTASGVEVVETAADMVHDIDRVHKSIVALGATDFFRIARSARFLDDDMIEGFHVTHALRGAMPVFEPYESRMILRHVNGTWKACFAEHEISNSIISGRQPRALSGIFSSRWTGSGARRTSDPTEALAVYGATVESMARHASAGDFEGWAAHYTTPHMVHYDTGDDRVETLEDARRYFDILHATMANVGADTLMVRPSYAMFLSDDRLVGYHEASLVGDNECRFGPVQSRIILVQTDGRWFGTSVSNALSSKAFTSGAFEPSDRFPTLREIQQRKKT